MDLFAGAGGFAEGFRQAGWRILSAVDNDRYAAETFKLNFPKATFFTKDIADLQPAQLLRDAGLRKGELDCLLGGPPCQSFSYNNHARSATTQRAQLFEHYLRIVEKVRPKTLVMENVPGMLTIGRGRIVKQIRSKLAELGYETEIRILFAEDFGVPQERRRVFLVATRLGGTFRFPRGTHGPARKPSEEANAYVHRWEPGPAQEPEPLVTVWEAIGDLPPMAAVGTSDGVHKYTTKPRGVYQERLRQRSRRIRYHVSHRLSASVLSRIRSVPEGGDWRDIPRDLLPAGMKRARPNHHTKRYGRLSRSKLCCTILTKCDPHWGGYVHPLEDRTITVREAARLQSFPDRFRFCKLISKQYEQIGNAVPPLMAKRIAHALSRYVRARLKERMARRTPQRSAERAR